MSRADWSFFEHLLEEGQEYSTAIGRIWLTVLFLFRILVLGTAAESAWDDEQADFVCNTKQPGCTAVCYDKAFPISHFRYFVLQVIFVSTPTIFYFVYVAIRAKKEQQDVEGDDKSCEIVIVREHMTKQNAEEKDKISAKSFPSNGTVPKLKGRLLGAYAFSILLKVLLEGGFIAGLWLLYGGFFIAAKFECERLPCPHTVDCFVSRPTEKTIFTFYHQVIAAISLLLNLIELFHLLILAISLRLKKEHRVSLPQSERAAVQQGNVQHSQPTLGGAEFYTETRTNNADTALAVNWERREPSLVPSYEDCMESARSESHSKTSHHKKHTQLKSKWAQQAQKHYV